MMQGEGRAMQGFDSFLLNYGLLAVFVLMFAKYTGVPIPIPADVIILAVAAGASSGKFLLWQAFVVMLVAIVGGGLIQFLLVRGTGRGLLYRFGRFLGLTPARLDAASRLVKRGGVVGISGAMLVPGIRGVAIVACGLADFSLLIFSAGLAIGSIIFLSIHFFIGYLGGSLLLVIGRIVPLTVAVPVILLLFVIVYILGMIALRRQKAAVRQKALSEGEALGLWHEGICPVCLALYATHQLPQLAMDENRQMAHEKLLDY